MQTALFVRTLFSPVRSSGFDEHKMMNIKFIRVICFVA